MQQAHVPVVNIHRIDIRVLCAALVVRNQHVVGVGFQPVDHRGHADNRRPLPHSQGRRLHQRPGVAAIGVHREDAERLAAVLVHEEQQAVVGGPHEATDVLVLDGCDESPVGHIQIHDDEVQAILVRGEHAQLLAVWRYLEAGVLRFLEVMLQRFLFHCPAVGDK